MSPGQILSPVLPSTCAIAFTFWTQTVFSTASSIVDLWIEKTTCYSAFLGAVYYCHCIHVGHSAGSGSPTGMSVQGVDEDSQSLLCPHFTYEFHHLICVELFIVCGWKSNTHLPSPDESLWVWLPLCVWLFQYCLGLPIKLYIELCVWESIVAWGNLLFGDLLIFSHETFLELVWRGLFPPLMFALAVPLLEVFSLLIFTWFTLSPSFC